MVFASHGPDYNWGCEAINLGVGSVETVEKFNNIGEGDFTDVSRELKGNFHMQRVFAVDKNERPLMPCHPARVRELLKKGQAAVYRQHPFTIIILDREGGDVQEMQVKVDPGAKTTEIAIVADFKHGPRCIWAT